MVTGFAWFAAGAIAAALGWRFGHDYGYRRGYCRGRDECIDAMVQATQPAELRVRTTQDVLLHGLLVDAYSYCTQPVVLMASFGASETTIPPLVVKAHVDVVLRVTPLHNPGGFFSTYVEQERSNGVCVATARMAQAQHFWLNADV